MKELVFGHGKVLAASIVDKSGRVGVVLRAVGVPRRIDESDPDWKDGAQFFDEPDDVVIWFDNLAGARVLQDRINIACLQLNRFSVVDSTETDRGEV